MSKMGEIALRLTELEEGIADNSWSIEMVTAEINCLMDLGFETEMARACINGISRWYHSGMPRGSSEVNSEVA